jgi:putative PIN family toxin of toxin-antitoxin system
MKLDTVSHTVRVVIDTNILVSGLRSTKGSSFRVLRGVRAGLVRPVVSVPLFLEYEEVLLRPGLLPPHMPDQAVAAFLDAFLLLAEPREIHFLWRPWLRDADDECVLETALAAGNVPIITHNLSDFAAASTVGVRIMTPHQLVSELNLP